jgi:hydrogenase expression/formation protein HypC
MCLAIPGQIVRIHPERPDVATVDVEGVQREISLGLLTEAEALGPGDWVLVYAGCALSKIDEAQARDALAFFQELQDAYDEALSAS